MLEYLSQLVVVSGTNVYCIQGYIQTLNGILMFSENVFAQKTNISFILTGRLSQDPLENLFSIVRGRGGYCNNPSVFEFLYIIAKIIALKLIAPPSSLSNSEIDDDVILDWDEIRTDILNGENSSDGTSLTSENTDTNSSDKKTVTFKHTSDILNTDRFEKVTEIPISWPSIRYFAGYVLFKMQQRIPCNSCKQIMVKNENLMYAPSELLIHYKNYSKENGDFGGLLPPTDVFFEICELHVTIFDQFFQSNAHVKNLKQKLVEMCINETEKNNKFEFWFDKNNNCHAHRVAILDFLLLVLIRKSCTWLLEKLNSKKKKTISKEEISSSNKRLKILMQ